MGSLSSERGRTVGEWSSHKVTISHDFHLGENLVTNAQFAAFLNENGNSSEENIRYVNAETGASHLFKTNDGWSIDSGYENHPVNEITWIGARDFCVWLNELMDDVDPDPGLHYRLPTEAEWEYCCRAGTSTRFSFGNVLDCDDLCGECTVMDRYMWWCGNYDGGTQDIGLKLANPWGFSRYARHAHGMVFRLV